MNPRQIPGISHVKRDNYVADGDRFLFKHPHPDTKIDPREYRTIARLRKEGWTLQKIADRFGVSRQRIHQILKRCGDDSTR